jgi:hypothetical protein
MRHAPVCLLLFALSGCAGRFFSLTNASSTAAPDNVYACVQEQLKNAGYQRTHYDIGDRWYAAQKVDRKARVADVRFRQRVDRLDIRVRPEASGNSSLQIKAQTFDQFDNQRGLDESERPVSNQARLDAQTMVEACGK